MMSYLKIYQNHKRKNEDNKKESRNNKKGTKKEENREKNNDAKYRLFDVRITCLQNKNIEI